MPQFINMETLLRLPNLGPTWKPCYVCPGNLATFALHMPQETHRYGNLAAALPFWSRYSAPFWDHYEQRVPTCGLQNGGKACAIKDHNLNLCQRKML